MKRRSARPFVVEVKNASRTGHTALGGVRTGDRSEDSLWRGLLTSADTRPEMRPSVASAAASASSRPASLPETAAPIARRILPNLMPPVAPEPEIAEPEPIVRRRGPNRRPRKAATMPSAPTIPTAPITMPGAAPAATGPAGSRLAAETRPAPKPAHRRSDTLKPGERWKRRLSRFAR